MVLRSPISAFPPQKLVPLSNTFPTMIFSIVMCCCCCIPFTSTITHFTGTVCVRSSWSLRQIQLFLHRSHVVINSDRLTNQIAIIVASFCLVHSLIGVYISVFSHDTSTSMMTINDDTYNRHIRRIVTNYRLISLQYYSIVPPKDYCVCVLCIVVYTSAYEHLFFCCCCIGGG